jgi:hypothetical protein
MLYSKQWRQLSEWSSNVPIWILLGMTPFLPIVMILAGICYRPRTCAVGIALLLIAYGLVLWIGVQPIVLGRGIAKTAFELYVVSAGTMLIGFAEYRIRRCFFNSCEEGSAKSTERDEPSDAIERR